MTNSTQKVTHTIFAEENLYVVTIDVVKVTGTYFNAVTVPAIYLRYSSSGHGTCQSTKSASIRNTNTVTEFLENEFQHKASKNTDVASNGKSKTDISLTSGHRSFRQSPPYSKK
jgi:hypothetical protein